LDGEETSYFEWLGAGTFEIHETAGAMHQATRHDPWLTLVQFGFDQDHLHVRIDATRPMVDLLADGHELSLKFLQPESLRFSVKQVQGRLIGLYWERRLENDHGQMRARWLEHGPG